MSYFYRCCKALMPFLVFISFNVFSQQDTLKTFIQTNGLEKHTILEKWCNQKLFFQKPPRKIKLLNELEQLALEKKDRITLAYVIFYRGLYVMAMDNHQHEKGIALMQKAIAMADQNGQKLQVAYFKHSLGYYYFTGIKNPVEAIQNMLQAHYIFDQIGYQNIYDQSGRLDRLAYVYFHLSNFNESIKYLKLSLKYPMENARRHIGILNTIGLSHRELVELDSAKKYFQLSRQRAILAKDTAWIGLNSGNIGRLLLDQKLYNRAKPFIEEYLKCSLIVKDSSLVIEALTSLGEVALNSGKIDLALEHLKQAEILSNQALSADVQAQNYVRKQYLFSVLSKAWDAKGNASRSLDYLKEADKIKDSIERRAKLSKNVSIQQMFEAEQTNNRLQLLREEKQTEIIKQRFYISIGILFAIIIVLLYSRQIRERKIQKQKEALLNLEKEKTESELKSSQEQLEEYIYNLKQKSELIEKIQSEMELMQKQNHIPVEDEQMIFHKLSIATILTEEDWNHFRRLFEKVHIGFFMKLKTIYPDLTSGEIRLCSLIKLGFNSHQMAAMMGISTVSIKKNRQRLRKKINLSKDQKLEELFMSF